jgi:tetratricopeptide (TPR) repeat protein
VEGLEVLVRNDLWTASGKREPSSFYRPLTMVTFWVNAQITGQSAAAMRAGNILLHAINAILLMLLLRRLFEPPRWMPAGMLAALWGVLAINSEPILWISGRFDPLTAMAALACLLANRRQSRSGAALVVLFATCGLLFKEAFMGWLPLLVLDDLLLQRRSIKLITPKYLGLGVVIGANMLLRKWVDIPSLSVISETGLGTVVESYLYTFATLVPRAFVPYGLDPFHPYAPLPLGLSVSLAAALVAITVWIAWRALRRGATDHARLTAFGWCWLILGLVPASLTGPNLFMIGDRYAYLPAIGLFLIAHAELHKALPALENRWGRRAFDVIGVVLSVTTLGQALALVNRTPDWRDDRTLAEASIRSHPDNPYALYTLGAMAIEEDDLERAEPLLMRAAQGNPLCWRTPNAICVLRLRQGRYAEAQTACLRSISFHPLNPRGWVNLASVYVNEKKWVQAKQASLKAVEIKPFFPEARYLAAVSHANLGELPAAQEHLEAGLEEDPTHPRLLDLQRQMRNRR